MGHIELFKMIAFHKITSAYEVNETFSYVVSKNMVEFAKELIKHPNLDINYRNKCNFTAFMCALVHNNNDIIFMLTQHPKLDVNTIIMIDNNNRIHPLLFIYKKGNMRMFEYLLGRPDISKESVEEVILHTLKFKDYQAFEKILSTITIDIDPVYSEILSNIKNNEIEASTNE